MMLKAERQQKILNEVYLRNRILLTDMAEQLNVSADTIRRDVKELDQKQMLKKVHGGAISLGFITNNGSVEVYDLEEKRLIANKALPLISDDAVIFIDGGTTCMELVKMIPLRKKITCFTVSLPIAIELVKKQNINLIFIGGKISHDSHMSISIGAVNEISQIKFDYSFISTGYIDPNHGLSEFDWEVVQVKRGIIKASRKTVLLCISKKFNSQQKYKCVDVNDIDTMITELDREDIRLDSFKNLNINLI
ncbi:MAG: DeoR/GlpR family DNA-binding transcription regulator [Flavobacteriaceae bacterium]|jgi:DeoR family fructose operon transcriptional repressor